LLTVLILMMLCRQLLQDGYHRAATAAPLMFCSSSVNRTVGWDRLHARHNPRCQAQYIR
jgi:hypothetical protein